MVTPQEEQMPRDAGGNNGQFVNGPSAAVSAASQRADPRLLVILATGFAGRAAGAVAAAAVAAAAVDQSQVI
jgi:ABC-type uncharacterized transport system permease subunit